MKTEKSNQDESIFNKISSPNEKIEAPQLTPVQEAAVLKMLREEHPKMLKEYEHFLKQSFELLKIKEVEDRLEAIGDLPESYWRNKIPSFK